MGAGWGGGEGLGRGVLGGRGEPWGTRTVG